MHKIFRIVPIVLSLAWSAAITAQPLTQGAASYPARPIRIVTPFPPGGGLDVIARVVAQHLTDEWRQQAVVDNRPGAGGTIGSAIAAKAAADGYTLLMIGSPHAINPALYAQLPYDTLNDFAPIALVTAAPHLLVVHPSLAVTSVKELIALAKSRPGQIAYASGGLGASSYLAAELLKSMAGIDLLHVPYKGTTPALIDVLSGQVPVTFGTVPTVMQHVKAGKLRALGSSGAKRSLAAPDVPTIAEAGLAGYEAATWHGLLAPAATPAAIVSRLNAALLRMLNDTLARQRILNEGLEPLGSTPEQFGAHLRAEVPKWAKLIRSAGLKAQ